MASLITASSWSDAGKKMFAGSTCNSSPSWGPMFRVLAVPTVALLLIAAPIDAADRADKSALLSIDLSRRVIVDTTRKRDAPLLDVNRYTIRRDDTTVIEIGQQNPLLFAYEAKNEKTDTEDYQAALTFAKQLKSFLDLFPGQGGNITAKRVRGLDTAEFQKDLKTLSDLIEGLPGALADSLGSAEQVAEMKKAYASPTVNVLTARLDADFNAMAAIARDCLVGTVGLKTDSGEAVSCDGPALLNDNVDLGIAAAKVAAAADRARGLAALIAAASSRQVEAQKKKDKTAIQAISGEIARLKSEKEVADAAVTQTAAEVQRRRTTPSARPTLIEFVQLAMVLDERAHHEMTLLREFAADAALVQTPLTLITAPYSIQRQTITVQIKSSGKYETLLDATTRKKRDDLRRTFTIVLEPYQPAHLSLAPAFVIGFLRNPEFTAVKKGDGFVIEQKDSALTRYTLGAMLNITPDGWQEPTFGGHFQVGITPTKDQFGFYFGAGLRVQRLFTFGGGLMIQQVRRLAGGLTIDSKLTDPSELKTDMHFKQGLYLHVTVDLPK